MTIFTKATVFLAIAAACACPAFAQQFQRVIGTDQEERSEWIAPTADGGSVICGFQDGAEPRPYVVKLDAAGATQWDTLLTGIGLDVPNRVVQTSDGGYALAGETSSGPAGFGISLIRLDNSGNYLWSRCYEGTAFVGGFFGQTAMEETEDSGFILSGRKQISAQTNQVGVLIRTDPNGNVIWQKDYNDARFGDAAFCNFSDVHQTPDLGFIVTGFTSGAFIGSRDTILMKTDAAGNVSWFKTYGFENPTDAGLNCARAQNGDYLVSGYNKNLGEGGGTFLMRTDPSGNLILYRTYRLFDGGHCMYETPDENIIISGNALDFLTFNDASLLNVDGAGNLNWCMAYGDGDLPQEHGEALALMPGGGFQLAGWTNVYGSGNFDIYTVRTNSAGISTCNERPHEPIVGDDEPPVVDVPIEIRDVDESASYQLASATPEFNNLVLCKEVEGGCVEPPFGMVAWYPLDASEPSPLVDELAFNNQGAPFNGTAVSSGFVNESAFFDGNDDFYQAPNAPQINFGIGDFSIDAWIRTTNTGGVRIIVDKRVEAGTVTGYSFFTFGGNLSLQLADGGFTNYLSSAFVADGQWHLVAVTVDRDNLGVFYVDGVPVDTFNPTGRTGSLTNPSVLRLGARSSSNTANWEGNLDEVELFRRVLTEEEVLGLYNAGPDGKCRDSCHAKWDAPFCAGENSIITTATICNNGTAPAMYSLTLSGLSVTECGTIDGPTSFTILDPMPVTVNPGDCATVSISVERPVDMNSVYDIGCFETVWTNLSTGFTTACRGSVIDRRDLCAVIDLDPVVDIFVPVDEPIVLPIVFSDPSGVGGEFEFQIITMPSDPNAPSITSLDGLPPGEPVIGTIKIPPQGTAEIELEARLLDHEPFVFYDIILLVADDNGNFFPSDSVVFRSLAPDTECPDMRGDINGDGVVNLLDVQPFVEAVSTGQFVCAADVNGDGVVNLLDVEPFIDLLNGG